MWALQWSLVTRQNTIVQSKQMAVQAENGCEAQVLRNDTQLL